ncbi:hypothetical protein CXG81DRAFT_26456 [Caulochytrium protostelioides]|uniref:Uncharacterized protein n=1 Tax=Caulochytrium protostelioides TaxID=1555241 RepID=A0A4P9X7B7_9FUNG|nr:hypothetical protein CXG81DRAFT_26456 [Caulochytrium protostelioides]|eukprot:RKP00831.1 hypothetical protein CXG81DRAFT_26456 [Caulochytrium protostelioides]
MSMLAADAPWAAAPVPSPPVPSPPVLAPADLAVTASTDTMAAAAPAAAAEAVAAIPAAIPVLATPPPGRRDLPASKPTDVCGADAAAPTRPADGAIYGTPDASPPRVAAPAPARDGAAGMTSWEPCRRGSPSASTAARAATAGQRVPGVETDDVPRGRRRVAPPPPPASEASVSSILCAPAGAAAAAPTPHRVHTGRRIDPATSQNYQSSVALAHPSRPASPAGATASGSGSSSSSSSSSRAVPAGATTQEAHARDLPPIDRAAVPSSSTAAGGRGTLSSTKNHSTIVFGDSDGSPGDGDAGASPTPGAPSAGRPAASPVTPRGRRRRIPPAPAPSDAVAPSAFLSSSSSVRPTPRSRSMAPPGTAHRNQTSFVFGDDGPSAAASAAGRVGRPSRRLAGGAPAPAPDAAGLLSVPATRPPVRRAGSHHRSTLHATAAGMAPSDAALAPGPAARGRARAPSPSPSPGEAMLSLAASTAASRARSKPPPASTTTGRRMYAASARDAAAAWDSVAAVMTRPAARAAGPTSRSAPSTPTPAPRLDPSALPAAGHVTGNLSLAWASGIAVTPSFASS